MWYNNHLFDELFPLLSSSKVPRKPAETNSEFVLFYICNDQIENKLVNQTCNNPIVNHYNEFQECDQDHYVTDIDDNDDNDINYKVTYQEVMRRMSKLARIIQNDHDHAQCSDVLNTNYRMKKNALKLTLLRMIHCNIK